MSQAEPGSIDVAATLVFVGPDVEAGRALLATAVAAAGAFVLPTAFCLGPALDPLFVVDDVARVVELFAGFDVATPLELRPLRAEVTGADFEMVL